MAANNRARVLELIFGHEGRYSNHPADPGGPTMYGITAVTLGKARKLGRAATVAEVKALTLGEAHDILSKQYLDPVKFDALPSGLDYAVADFSVNSGPAQAVKTLQRVLGVDRDGAIGVNTLDAIGKQPIGRLIIQYQSARLAFMKGLSNWSSFGKGWTTRVKHVQEIAVQMAGAAAPIEVKLAPAPEPLADGGDAKADPKETTVASTGRGKANIGTVIGAATATIGTAGPALAPYIEIPWVKSVGAGLVVLGIVLAIIGSVTALVMTRNHIANGNPV
jgi:lysozyme family protein